MYGEAVHSRVATALVDATEAVILFSAHVLQVVIADSEPLVVEEVLGDERALARDLAEVAFGPVDVEAEICTFTHGDDELRSGLLSDLLVGALAEADFHDMGAKLAENTLVLHEGRDIARLVPDEQIFALISGFLNDPNDRFEAMCGPVRCQIALYYLIFIFNNKLSFT